MKWITIQYLFIIKPVLLMKDMFEISVEDHRKEALNCIEKTYDKYDKCSKNSETCRSVYCLEHCMQDLNSGNIDNIKRKITKHNKVIDEELEILRKKRIKDNRLSYLNIKSKK